MKSLMPLAPRLVSSSCGIVTSLRRISKDPIEPELPYIYRAELANHGFASDEGYTAMVASGKGFTQDAAATGALGEAVERYCASLWSPKAIRYSTRAALTGRSLDPSHLVLYAPEQYETLPKYSPYRAETVMGWVEGKTVGRADPIWLPALAIYLSYQAGTRDEFLCPVSSSGLACGPTDDTALAKAACELIEREAFMMMWHHRIPPVRMDLSGHPDATLHDLVAAYARRGVGFEVYRLRTDLSVPVVMALGIDAVGRGPAIVVGLGAAPDLCAATLGAVLEVAQVRPALRIRMRAGGVARRAQELVADPSRVDSLEDHDLLYAVAGTQLAFDFIRQQPAQAVDWSAGMTCRNGRAGLDGVTDALAQVGLELHYIDVTPDDIAALGLRTVRAIVPDMQPIHFGAREIRLGGRRFYEVAAALLGKTSLGPQDVHLAPHPLS